jgi:ribonuclease Z
MAQVILLGTGAALSGPDRENTFMLVRGRATNILIDCGGSPTQRLAQLGLKPSEIDHVVLTHNHPDHIYGFPMLILNAWMAGRKDPINVYGLEGTIKSARGVLEALDFELLPNLTPIQYHVIAPKSITALPPMGEFDIKGAPTKHFVPTLALRITERATGHSIAYSSDTAPNPNVVELARDVKIFFHEATMLDSSSDGHSSAVEAGAEAAAANVGELVLIHVPPNVNPSRWREAAAEYFDRQVTVAEDFDVVEF